MAPTDLIAPSRQRAIPIALLVLGALLLAARLVVWMTDEPETTGDAVRWVPLAQAAAMSEKSGKPIMYDFTAEWCPPCHQLDAQVFRNARYAEEINRRFIPVRVLDRQRETGANSPEVQAVQDAYRINSFPTVLFADAAGRELGRMEGFRSPKHFGRVMDTIRR